MTVQYPALCCKRRDNMASAAQFLDLYQRLLFAGRQSARVGSGAGRRGGLFARGPVDAFCGQEQLRW
jgi:hypothetical protein